MTNEAIQYFTGLVPQNFLNELEKLGNVASSLQALVIAPRKISRHSLESRAHTTFSLERKVARRDAV